MLNDNRRPLNQAVLWTAEACARVKDHDGVREVLNHKAIANKEEVRRDIVMKVLQIQSEIGDAKGARPQVSFCRRAIGSRPASLC